MACMLRRSREGTHGAKVVQHIMQRSVVTMQRYATTMQRLCNGYAAATQRLATVMQWSCDGHATLCNGHDPHFPTRVSGI